MKLQRAICLLILLAAPLLYAAAPPSEALRADAFVAAPYDADSALVFFDSTDLPANLGAPAGPWPQQATHWLGAKPQLQFVKPGMEAQWARRWPGGEEHAPKLGGEYILALGGDGFVHGTLVRLGYLPLCDTTWLVGIVRVRDGDRGAFTADHAEGFAAYAALTEPKRTALGSGTGAVLRSEDQAAFSAETRAKIEPMLKSRATADYAKYLKQRQDIYDAQQTSTLAQVQGSADMTSANATLTYSAQQYTVAPGTRRYYLRAVWRSHDKAGNSKVVYRMNAWFTPEWEMESVADSLTPLEDQAGENGRVLNLFPLPLLPMMQQGDDGERGNILLMQERGPEGATYLLKRWTPGGTLPTGVFFANRCKMTTTP